MLHRFELRIAVWTALALLFAQWGAMSHAYSHDVAVGSPGASHLPASNSHDPCNECLAYAPLLCAAGSSTALPWVEPPGHGLASRATADSLVNLDLTLAFRSRAPPTSL